MIAVIACVKSKYNATNQEARLIYWKSNLFKLSYLVIKKFHPDVSIFILSAKYGLIKETDIISSYEKTIKTMTKEEKEEMKNKIDQPQDYIFIGGKEYKSILKYLPSKEYGENLPIGKKMQYLKSLL